MRNTGTTFYNEKDSYFDEDSMSFETRCRLKSEYSVRFRNGFDDISKARMRGYLTALQDMYLMSINESTRVQECIAHEVPKLTDDYIDFWMF